MKFLCYSAIKICRTFKIIFILCRLAARGLGRRWYCRRWKTELGMPARTEIIITLRKHRLYFSNKQSATTSASILHW